MYLVIGFAQSRLEARLLDLEFITTTLLGEAGGNVVLRSRWLQRMQAPCYTINLC